MTTSPSRPYTVGICDHDAGDDDYHWYKVEGADEYDAAIHAIQQDDTSRTSESYDEIPMSYDEARLVLHGDRSQSIWVIAGHHDFVTPWSACRERSPWLKKTTAESHLRDAKSAVENLEKLINPLRRLPGIMVPADLQKSFDSCKDLLLQLEQSVKQAEDEIHTIRASAEATANERQGLIDARKARAKQAAQEAERQAALEKAEDAKDDLTAQRQLARG